MIFLFLNFGRPGYIRFDFGIPGNKDLKARYGTEQIN
jgi:hypothetical protein